MSSEHAGTPPDYTPTTGEVERAWMMRQFTLDVEAGREPDPVQYAREFRRWLLGHEEKISAARG